MNNYKDKAQGSLALHMLRKSLLPILIIILMGILYFIYLFKFKAIFTEFLNKHIAKGALVIFTLIITYGLQRISKAAFSWYAENIAVKTDTRLDDEFIPLLRKAISIVLWVITLLIILSNLGININALLATLGVSSLAIALAAQDTIANIIAGFLIMIDRPFRIGDEIKLPSGERVKVLDIGIRRSRFLNLEDKAIIIAPNLELSKSKIVNFTYAKERKEV